MKSWKIPALLGLAALGAAAFALSRRKTAAPAPAAGAAKPAPAPARLKTGSYSFISGFQNAATVEMTLDYDADAFGFSVVSEDFLSYSSDSHVALLQGVDFSLQLEYASYLPGAEADGQWKFLEEKHPDLSPVRYGQVEAVKYLEGDALCFCLPIPEDGHSYVQVLLFKAKDNDTPLPDMAEDPVLAAVLSSVRFTRR